MRNRFGSWFLEKAEYDDRMILLSGDIGFGIFDDLRDKKPQRFLNCGIAEQNMIGVAAGLAARGYRPFVYTIIPFLLFRPFEFIRNLVGHQNLPVVLVGVGGGFSYDNLGYTHYAKEDLVLASSLPNFDVYSPCDRFDAEHSFERALASSNPSFIRLMKGGEPLLLDEVPKNGVSTLVDFGSDLTIVTHGGIASEAVSSAQILRDSGILIKVISVNIFRHEDRLSELCNGPVLIVEEQIKPGLLNEALITLQNKGKKVFSKHIHRDLDNNFMNRSDILGIHGLDAKAIVQDVKDILKQT